MKRFVFISVWILSIVSCEPIEDKPLGIGAIQGQTFIGSTNASIQGLTATLPGYGNKTTDINGFFRFENVLEGNHTVSVYQASKFLSSKSVSVKEGNTSFISFSFEYSILPKKNLSDFTVIDISKESNWKWDYEVAGKEECFYIDVENSKPKFVLYHSFKTGKDYGITFDDKGLPSKVLTDNFVFLFDNFNGNKVDLGILSPSGDIQIFREVKTDFIWSTSTKSLQSKADVIRWTGRILGAIPCVTLGVSAVVTGGAAIPLALWTCGNYFLKLADGFFDDANVVNGFTKFVSDYSLVSTFYTCTTDPSSCLLTIAFAGLDKYAAYIKEMESKENLLRIVEASLYAGHGDIQITLTWDNKSDLDLHVIDPFGNEISWDNQNSVSGGILDYDNMDGYGPENVYWPKSKAPKGTYEIFVNDFYWAGRPNSANYIVLVNAFGRTKKFTGTINLKDTKYITSFNESSIFSTKFSVEIPIITIKSKK